MSSTKFRPMTIGAVLEDKARQMTGQVPAPKTVYYANPPSRCDLCQVVIDSIFFDCKTRMGPWGNICRGCFQSNGIGLGIGKGQRYEKQADGKFLKTAG